ncbi:MAG: metallophosphoesterase [Acidobacteriota bacterium]|nr:metallophosphoesterase [Acidobacteriota bacterium]MDH3786215.1 metallophosphoesterase [Acidobacteriota bacterium]
MRHTNEILLPYPPPTSSAEESLPQLPSPGWFRRVERDASHFLARYLLPWVPGIDRPYSAILERQLQVRNLAVTIDGMPSAFHGFKILFLSDIHAGPFLRPATLSRCVTRLLAREPDLIVIAGDIVTSSIAEYVAVRESFRRLTAAADCFTVLGNHDHYADRVGDLQSLLEEDGIHVLTNRSVPLERCGAKITLAGIDDLLMGRPDFTAALREASGPVVLLTHHPDVMYEAAKRGVDLVLAGHTHGGQIRFGGFPPLVRQSRLGFHEGRFRCARTRMLVSRGMGVVGLPIRAACDPEAWILTLQDSRESVDGVSDALGDFP